MNDIILDNLITKFSILDLLSIIQPSLLYSIKTPKKKKQTNSLSLINNTFVAGFVASIWHHPSSKGLYGFFFFCLLLFEGRPTCFCNSTTLHNMLIIYLFIIIYLLSFLRIMDANNWIVSATRL
jgi:hypothetical protein